VNQDKLVSIMLPTSNSQYLVTAIMSCLGQTYKNLEVIVFDDQTTDAFDMVKDINDERVRYFTGDGKVNCPRARNSCVSMSRGDIIARLDSDDYDDPTRIEKSVTALESYDLVSCQMKLFSDDRPMKESTSGAMNPEMYWRGVISGPVNASIVAHKYVYDRVKRQFGNYFPPKYIAGSDGAFNFRVLTQDFSWGFIPEHLYYYRQWPKQLTKRFRQLQRDNHETARRLRGKV